MSWCRKIVLRSIITVRSNNMVFDHQVNLVHTHPIMGSILFAQLATKEWIKLKLTNSDVEGRKKDSESKGCVEIRQSTEKR